MQDKIIEVRWCEFQNYEPEEGLPKHWLVKVVTEQSAPFCVDLFFDPSPEGEQAAHAVKVGDCVSQHR